MQTKRLFKKCKFSVCIFYIIIGISYTHSQNDSSSDYYSDYDSDNSTEMVANTKFLTECETPNYEPAFCMKISKCPVLADVKEKLKYEAFIEASRCGPKNENKKDFKVCCGQYNDFRYNSVSSPSPSNSNLFPKECGTQKKIIRGRIVGGVEAALGEYPWMVRIIHKNDFGKKSFGCAGFLIHKRYVITAAHCIVSENSQIRGNPYSVLLGEHNITSDIDCSPGGTFCADPTVTRRIEKVSVHEQYDMKSKHHHNDIALIHLRKKVNFTEYIRPICLLTEVKADTKSYHISGWGRTETREISPVKLKLELKVFDKEECKNKYESIVNLEIDDTQICAGGEKKKDSCNGDSGGPLMTTDDGSRFCAAGIVSYGIGCGMAGWPGVYTSIPSFVDWITVKMISVTTRSRIINQRKKKAKTKKLSSIVTESSDT